MDLDLQIAHTFTVLKIPFEFIHIWDVESYYEFVSYYNSNVKQISNSKSGNEKVVKLTTPDDMETL